MRGLGKSAIMDPTIILIPIALAGVLALPGIAVVWGMMRAQIAGLRRDAETFKEELRDLRGNVALHITDSADVKADIASAKTSIESMRDDFREFREDFRELMRNR